MRNGSRNKSKLEGGQQTVLFQIANGNARQDCSLKTKFSTQHQASRYLRQNWNRIEKWREIVWQGNASKMAGSIW